MHQPTALCSNTLEMEDSDDTICPLCTEPLDATERTCSLCQCGYSMCLWCASAADGTMSLAICRAARWYATIRRLVQRSVVHASQVLAPIDGECSERKPPRSVPKLPSDLRQGENHAAGHRSVSVCTRLLPRPVPPTADLRCVSSRPLALAPYCLLWLVRLEEVAKEAQRKKPERKPSLPSVKQRRDLAVRHCRTL